MIGREPYLSAAVALIAESGCTVRKWRRGTSGVAYTASEDWGIEVPEPRGPVSFATFAHEVGHQLLHRRNGDASRWLEECEAWEFALAQFDRFELPGKIKAQNDAATSLARAAAKAIRRSNRRDMLVAEIRARYPAWVVIEEIAC